MKALPSTAGHKMSRLLCCTVPDCESTAPLSERLRLLTFCERDVSSENETEKIGSSTVCLPCAGSSSNLQQAESSEEETGETEDMGSMIWSAAAGSNSSTLQTANERTSVAGAMPELDVGLWSTLGENLLEKVIARLPLHSLVRASLLSKECRDVKFCFASFQHEVNCCSSTASWDSFCPVFVTDEHVLLGFESKSRRWCRLPTLSYLPHVVRNCNIWTLIVACGSLLCLTGEFSDNPIFITNPLTRSWRQLPPSPEENLDLVREQVQLVCEGGSKTYKVLVQGAQTTTTL